MKLYDTKKSAKYLGVSKKTLERKRLDGTGPSYKKIGARVMYARHEIDKWVNQNTYSSTSQYCHKRLSP